MFLIGYRASRARRELWKLWFDAKDRRDQANNSHDVQAEAQEAGAQEIDAEEEEPANGKPLKSHK